LWQKSFVNPNKVSPLDEILDFVQIIKRTGELQASAKKTGPRARAVFKEELSYRKINSGS